MSTTRLVAPPAPGTAMVWSALSVVYVVWGSTYLAIRVVVEADIPPLLSAGVRFLTAGSVLAAIIAWRNGVAALRVSPDQLKAAATIGALLLVGGNGVVVLAEQTVPSGLAALLVAAVPLWVVLLRAGSRDGPSRRTTTGVLLGFAGVGLLSLTGGSATGAEAWGVLLILGASMSWAFGSFISGRVGMPHDPFVAAVYEMLAGGLLLVVIGMLAGEARDLNLGAAPLRGWVALGYLVVFGSVVAFTSYVWLLHRAPISLVATYAYVNPAVAVVLGAVVLSEPVTGTILLGGAVVIVGVGIVVSREKPREPRDAEVEPAT